MGKYSAWKHNYNDEYIKRNYPGRCTKDFIDRYNKDNGSDICSDSLRHHIYSLKLSNHCSDVVWTKEKDDWLIENYSKLGRKRACELFIGIFNEKCSIDTISTHATKKLGLKVDREVACRNRHPLHGDVNVLYSDGTIRENEPGYKVIKVNNKWIPYRRYIWNKYKGEIPKGYVVTYLDDPDDYSIENLACVDFNVERLLSSKGLRGKNKTITRCGIAWGELYYALKGSGVDVSSWGTHSMFCED